MARGLIGIPSRLAFGVCGLISLRLSQIYLSLRVLDLASARSWLLFSIALSVVGGLGILIALLPTSWVRKLFKVEPGRSTSIPIKMLAGFAIVSYVAVLVLPLVSPAHASSQFAFLVCPACALTLTVDPPFAFILLVLGPFSAAVYGCLGGVLGYISVIVSRNRVS